MKSKTHLRLECLEDRCVPAAWGNPWPDATHLTLSFAPDGTRAGGATSELFRKLDAAMPRDVWQREILRAFQTWASRSNITVGLVSDGGQAFGAKGPIQGDSRFGDIRIGAVPLGSDALASAFPFDVTAGTWAGDVRLNSTFTFGPGGYDLYTVMLQEAGHVFGIGNSTDPNSVMFEDYAGKRAGLGTGDVAGLQTLYGARKADGFEGNGNETLGTARRLSLLANASGSLSVTALGDLTTSRDRDVYSVTTPLSLGSLVFGLRTSGLSMLTSKVSVFDSRGQLVASKSSVDPLNGNLTIRVDGVKLLSTYSIQVEGARGDVFGVGAYLLEVKYLPLGHELVGGLTGALGSAVDAVTELLANNDLHTNDSIKSAVGLQQLLATADSRLDAAYRGSISDRWDKDFYRVTAPSTTGAMTVMAWGTPSSLTPGRFLTPRVNVYDQYGKRVAADVLVNDGYTFTVQVANAKAGATYYVEVKAADPSGDHGTGNYFLGVDFSPRQVVLQTLAQGGLNANQRLHQSSLTTDMSGVHHFVLSAEGAAGDAVRMLVYDADGRVVFAMSAAAGESASGDVYLERGTYSIVFLGDTSSTLPGALKYLLRYSRLSDNNGPEPIDPTASPSNPPPRQPTGTPPPTTTSSTTKPSSGGVQPQEPTSDPYTAESDWNRYYRGANQYDGMTWQSGTATA